MLGAYESMAALRTSMTPDAKLAGLLLAQAQHAVQNARIKWAESLDFTPDSLDAIERMLGKMHNLAKYAAPGAGPTEEQISCCGNALGRLHRRSHPPSLRRAVGHGRGRRRSRCRVGEAQVFPIAKARKRIVDGPAENIRYYFASMAKVLQG